MPGPMIHLKQSTTCITVPEASVATWEERGYVRMTEAEIADQKQRRERFAADQKLRNRAAAATTAPAVEQPVAAPGG